MELGTVAVTVVNVRVMRVSMRQWFVDVRVSMRLGRVDTCFVRRCEIQECKAQART